jgi:predicted dehydrogenase
MSIPRELNIAMIGAGGVNFGGAEGPWNHCARLEKLPGLRVVAVVDPDLERARRRIAEHPGPMFAGAVACADCRQMLRQTRPDAVWIGVPPNAHGALEPGRDIERLCAEAGVHMFIEKPISNNPPETVRALAELIARAGVLSSVGYMFRYSRAVETIREILRANGGARALLARYNCAYSEIRKREWWDSRCSGGPIVEQATHFLDLARFIVGEVDPASVRALRLPADSPLGALADIPRDQRDCSPEDGVPAQFRLPRVTLAVWRFENGALGSLNHAALLHRQKYDTEIEIWGDGLRIVLADPYGECRVRVRRPRSETTEELDFTGDDPYLHENRAFVEAVRSGDATRIRSPYADAVKTHELAWAIAG